jgi:hypothetical protein
MDDTPKKRRRRWYQFSLRTPMVFVVVCAVGFGWVGWGLEKTRREQMVVAKIEAWRGWVSYHETDWPFWIARHFRRVETAVIPGPQVTDAGLEHLKELTDLRRLDLDGSQVTDAGLQRLKGLTNLIQLELSDTQVTDAGLEHLLGVRICQAPVSDFRGYSPTACSLPENGGGGLWDGVLGSIDARAVSGGFARWP